MDRTEFPVVSILIFGSLAMAILIFGLIIFVQRFIRERLGQQKKLLEATILTEEEVKKRIAGNLHDDVGGNLLTIKILISELINEVGKKSNFFPDLEKSNSILTTTLDSVRDLSFELMPKSLEKFGLIGTIDELCKGKKTDKMPIQFFGNRINEESLNKSQGVVIYRVLQELLNNAMKHSEASMVTVSTSMTDFWFILTVEDDGIGFNYLKIMNSPAKGIGLRNVLSRLQQVSGRIEYTSRQPSGTKVEVKIPIDQKNL